MADNNQIQFTQFEDRISSNPNRRKLRIISHNPGEILVDVERADESPTEIGTPLTAENLNGRLTEIKEDLQSLVTQKTGSIVQVKNAQGIYEAKDVNFDSDPQTQITAGTNAINTETSNRINADNNLQLAINNITTNNVKISNGMGGFSAGANASATASGAIQLGTGTNNTANSLQVHGDNIYEVGTKTLKANKLDLMDSFTALNNCGGGFSIADTTNVGIELGRKDSRTCTPYIDFRTNGNPNTDFNSRIIADKDTLNFISSKVMVNGKNIESLFYAFMGNSWANLNKFSNFKLLFNGTATQGNITISDYLYNYDVIFTCGCEDNRNGIRWICTPCWQLDEAYTNSNSGNIAIWYNSQSLWYLKNSSLRSKTLQVFAETSIIYKILGVKL